MSDFKVCRVCLETDVRMIDLEKYPYDLYFESVVGNPLLLDVVASHACFICADLVKKFYYFKEKCIRGQTVLNEVLHKISPQQIKNLDRTALGLKNNLVTHRIHEVETINTTPNETVQFEDLDLKKEDLLSTGPEEITVKEENVEIHNDFDNVIDNDNEFPSPAASSDDEPLSVYKKAKMEKVKKKKKTGKKKLGEMKFNEKRLKLDGLCFVSDDFPEKEVVPVKRKRGRPRKYPLKEPRPSNTLNVHNEEIDLDKYATTVHLTLQEQIDEVQKRKTSSNFLNAEFKCNICYKGFINRNAWSHHARKHSAAAGDIECPVCKIRFKSKRNLQKHSIMHDRKYVCKSCSHVSRSTTQAKQHQRWHKGVTYKCQHCDELFTKWTSFLSHVRVKHPSQHICGFCGYSFVSGLGLNMHIAMMHKDEAKTTEENNEDSQSQNLYCQECDVQFTSLEAWKRHMVTSAKHITNDQFTNGCRECGSIFADPEELRLHHRKMHPMKRPRNYGKKPTITTWPTKCMHCEEQLPNARQYWSHFRRAHPDKKYPIEKKHVCDICGKAFSGNAFLMYHKRTHSTERAFQCAQCPKAFFNRTNLQTHEKTHSDHRPYPCTVCHKAFKSKSVLERHFMCHTGVKPYQCEVCGKSFSQSNSRKLHVSTVHLKKSSPYYSRSRLERRRVQREQTLPTEGY